VLIKLSIIKRNENEIKKWEYGQIYLISARFVFFHEQISIFQEAGNWFSVYRWGLVML